MMSKSLLELVLISLLIGSALLTPPTLPTEKIIKCSNGKELPDLNMPFADDSLTWSGNPSSDRLSAISAESSSRPRRILNGQNPSSSGKPKDDELSSNRILPRPIDSYISNEPLVSRQVQQHIPSELDHESAQNFEPDVEGKLKRKRLTTESLQAVSNSKTTRNDHPTGGDKLIPSFFNVYDWDFVKVQDPEELAINSQKPYYGLGDFFTTLNFQRNGNFYFIDVNELANVITTFGENRFLLPRMVKTKNRPKIVGEILLKLANEKLNLEAYKVFSDSFLKHMRARLELRNMIHKESNKRYVTPKKINTISNFISNVTKISTFLIIMRLSLFMQHAEGGLNQRTVERIVMSIKSVWDAMEVKNIQKPQWAERFSMLLRLEEQNPLENEHPIYGSDKMLQMATRIVEHWAEENGSAGYAYKSTKGGNHQQLAEILSNIIIYANPNFVSKFNQSLAKKNKNKTKLKKNKSNINKKRPLDF
ncbi:hypothetical protein PGT21_019109 [Puccinia graminis f. sp. tritici]|uniref:Uncharacterized protein n=1 Tax=Puccinia graminis f. sp. tritici TaxID=56615 RepID=A0A5B0PTT2_PUCGR|nr:hypothetical protein PGTUg99_033796 [Puccinia graminis f. sp. tritici]KAA1104316.1 hypothetical protein PGT21_019109 [Puccinia graminis f. sp. tritici]